MRLQFSVRRRHRHGSALLIAVFASFSAATMVTALLAASMAANKKAVTTSRSVQARFLAEGAIEVAREQLEQAVANWQTPAPTGSATIDGYAVPWTCTPTGFATIQTDPTGVQTIVTGFEVGAGAQSQGDVFTAHGLMNTEATPIFQFAVFYDRDLEINPGPNMVLGGRVHSNLDMYLNCGATLTLNTNYVQAAGSIYRNRKDDPTKSEGTVTIRQWVANPFSGAEPSVYQHMKSTSQMAALGIATTSGYDARFTTGFDANGDGDMFDSYEAPWVLGAPAMWSEPAGYVGGTGETVVDNQLGSSAASVPQVGSISMFEPTTAGNYVWDGLTGSYVACAPGAGTHDKGYYHSNAGLSIVRYSNGTVKAFNSAGTDVTASLPAGTISSTTMYDARQANGSTTKTKVVDIDIAKLNTSGYFPSNGLLYAANYGEGTGTNATGFRMKNGSSLSKALTFVSEDPVYIKGDFNTSSKKGAAVIADAVNLLSNAWNDSKVKGVLPTASGTTYNVALICGNQDTVAGGQYNGGLENLPRFHENWSGKNCTIKGSFVNLWTSQYASGNWVYGGDKYTAPNRVWSYDTAFNTVANLPPFTPLVVNAVDVAIW